MPISKLIERELDRLGVSTSQDPYSGLSVAEVEENLALVNVFDDHASGNYHAQQLLDFLRQLSPEDVSLDYDSDLNIWQKIMDLKD
jgi:hypothetical protein